LKGQQEAATEALRRFLEMDRQYIAAAAISALSQQAMVDPSVLEQCVARYGLSGGVLAPWLA
jgi:pyruvate dehydrogenase complex dehydrogenase (E1) component